MKKILIGLLGAGMLIFMASTVFALQYGFEKITDNGNVDVSSQLVMDVTQNGTSVVFTFNNLGPTASSIADIYFDDDGSLLLGIAIGNSDGIVNFTTPATPGNLPGGNLASPPFVATANFSADSNAPVELNGVNPGEWLQILITINQGLNVFDYLNNGNLRVGLHVQAIGATGGSDGYVNDGVSVPEPGTLIFLGTGLLGLYGISRKKFKK